MAQIQPRKHVLHRADYTASTRQHEVGRTDREYICPERSRSSSRNRLLCPMGGNMKPEPVYFRVIIVEEERFVLSLLIFRIFFSCFIFFYFLDFLGFVFPEIGMLFIIVPNVLPSVKYPDLRNIFSTYHIFFTGLFLRNKAIRRKVVR